MGQRQAVQNARGCVMAKLPRFVQKRVSPSGGITYRYNPPQKFVNAGVVERVELPSDIREARKVAREYNKRVDEYREEQSKIVKLYKHSTVADLVDFYYQSNDYNMLRDTTKVDYKYCLAELCAAMGDRKYLTVTSKVAKQAYEEWVKRGVSFANHVATASSRVFNYAITMEEATVNPFGNIKRKQAKQRKVVWEHEHVIKFLDVAYSRFEFRNVGMIVQMAYEWCQRLGDMRVLTWDSIDLDNKQLYLRQSKRRAEVFLPISDDLAYVLKQQKDDFGFQQYVAPYYKARDGVFDPYPMERLSKAGRRIMRDAGLPEELRLMDLRRTGVTQMVDKGVPLPQIMSVTGHNHVSSVRPYMKHTYESANSALTQRNVCVKSNASE